MYPGRWIGLGGPIAWPPCSPDLNFLNVFFCDGLKLLVHKTPVAPLEDHMARIIVALTGIASTPDLFEPGSTIFLPLVCYVGCALTNAVATLNNYCNNHL
ncbi:hypothetical protein TNCV_470311 [Trichonephila clavipes]|nr:hypothetical protein TNCV_470311 [Trichonephila clavipes]